MPELGRVMGSNRELGAKILASLALLDQAVRDHGERRRSIQLSYLLGDCLFLLSPWGYTKNRLFL